MKLPENLNDAADKAKDLLDQTTNAATDKAKDLLDKAADAKNDLLDKAVDAKNDLLDKAADVKDSLLDKAADAKSTLLDKAADAKATLLDKAADAKAAVLDRTPDSLKDAGEKAVGAFNKLTTTQKVVGGALLAAGLAYLVAPKKKGKAKRKTAALDQLLLFVNDRVEGYKRAVDETKDGDLRAYYEKLVDQSRKFSDELNQHLTRKGGDRETGTTLKGKLYRKLMDAQATITGNNEKAILAANIYGEHWATKAYKKALRRKALKGDIRTAIEKQLAESKKTSAKLKELATKK